MGDRGTNETAGAAGGDAANRAAAEATSDAGEHVDEHRGEHGDEHRAEHGDDGPRELSRAAAVGATVLAIVCGCAAMLAALHWLGWTVPGIGWIVAKVGIKLSVGGFLALAVAAEHLRGKLRPKSRS
ncbi:hypothetical protein ACIQWA_09525 [Kitasatospora sp. NPDC098652]|uniref:hypothetical protein n=1 Tax=Kitasatospora sp. NPDC098652 TaxID=3364095 RepID=UPI0038214B47